MNRLKKIKSKRQTLRLKGGDFKLKEKIMHLITHSDNNLKKYVENVLKPGADVSVLTHEFAENFKINNNDDIESACIVLYVIMHRVDPNNTFQFPSTFITVETYQEKKKDILDKLKTLPTLNTSEYVKALQSVIELCSIPHIPLKKDLSATQRILGYVLPKQKGLGEGFYVQKKREPGENVTRNESIFKFSSKGESSSHLNLPSLDSQLQVKNNSVLNTSTNVEQATTKVSVNQMEPLTSEATSEVPLTSQDPASKLTNRPYKSRYPLKFPPEPPPKGLNANKSPNSSTAKPLPQFTNTTQKTNDAVKRTLPSVKLRYLGNFLRTKVTQPIRNRTEILAKAIAARKFGRTRKNGDTSNEKNVPNPISTKYKQSVQNVINDRGETGRQILEDLKYKTPTTILKS